MVFISNSSKNVLWAKENLYVCVAYEDITSFIFCLPVKEGSF
jgi:hypothetical protein